MDVNLSSFRDLWQNNSLYNDEFIRKFGINSPHWTFESDQKRELSLRHDYCCALLCNLESVQQKRLFDEVDRGFIARDDEGDFATHSKRMKMNEESEENIYESIEELELDFEPEDEVNELGEDERPDWVPLEEAKEGEEETKYRYMLLEGNLYSVAIQNHYCKKFNVDFFQKTFDIVDTVNKKFIEVKISLNPAKRFKEYIDDENTTRDTVLITIHPENYKIDITGTDERMPGEEKVVNFLMKRSMVMKKLRLSDSIITEEPKLEKTIFCSEYINNNLEEFKRMTEYGITMGNPTDFNRTVEADLTTVTPKDLFNLLEDPSSVEAEIVKWKGVLSPPLDLILQSCSDKDLDNITEFLNELAPLQIEKIGGDDLPFMALKEVIKEYVENPGNIDNFRFHKPTLSGPKTHERLKECLGIGRKNKIHNDGGLNMIQDEYPQIKKLRYDTWFEDVYSHLIKPHSFQGKASTTLKVEKLDDLDLGIELQTVVSKMITEVGKSNLGVMMSQYMNLGSRISGTYLVGSSKKTSHSHISCLPLIANLYSDEGKKAFRVNAGICFRAPHHARNANDNINLFVIERISKDKKEKTKYFQNECLVSGGMFNYRLRQTAIKKSVAVHLTFLYNSLFNSMNLMGEIALNNTAIRNMTEMTYFCNSLADTEGTRNYFLSRITESVLMAVIGNSRDEGYLSVARKMFMILLAWRRNESAFTWNLKEFADKLNECLIDNPLSMHFHMNFMYIISCYGSVEGE